MKYLYLNFMDEWGVGVSVNTALQKRVERKGGDVNTFFLGELLRRGKDNQLTMEDHERLATIRSLVSGCDKIYIGLHGTGGDTQNCIVQEGLINPVMTRVPLMILLAVLAECLPLSDLSVTLVMCYGGRATDWQTSHHEQQADFYKTSFAYRLFKALATNRQGKRVTLKAGMGIMSVNSNTEIHHIVTDDEQAIACEVEHEQWMNINGGRYWELEREIQQLERHIKDKGSPQDGRFSNLYDTISMCIMGMDYSPSETWKEVNESFGNSILRYSILDVTELIPKMTTFKTLDKQQKAILAKKNSPTRGGRIRFTTEDTETVTIEVLTEHGQDPYILTDVPL